MPVPLNTNCAIAWAAGFFDGEGTTGFTWRPSKRNRQLRLSIMQVNRENLDRFQKAVGDRGHICGPRRRGNNKPIWSYRIDKVDDIKTVVGLLWPFLSKEKQDQAERAIVQYETAAIEYGITRRRKYGERCERLTVPCGQCGKPVRVTMAYLNRGSAVHCSKSCAAKYAASIRWRIKDACA